tara:strand:- start:6332 stop:6703 length:372 start_codon:yes stop_codon:yes gene_type:complete
MLTKNYCNILILLLLVFIVYISITGSNNKDQQEYYTNLIEGYSNKGSKYLKEVQKANNKEIKSILKNIDSKDAATAEIEKLQQLTSVDTAITAALKTSSGGFSASGLFGGGSSSSSESDTDSD